MSNTNSPIKVSTKNCIRTGEKYIIDNPLDFITHYSIWPTESQSIGSKCNAILRLSIIIFILLLIVKYPYAPLFLFLAIVINIIFYYKWKANYE